MKKIMLNSAEHGHFNIYEQGNSILGLSEPDKSWISWYWVEHAKSFITSEPDFGEALLSMDALRKSQ